MKNGSPSDEPFLERLFSIVEDNLDNEQFGVSELAKDLGISRTKLHRKLHQINGNSASQVIREYRLEKAKEILENEDLTAAEVAYKVGFGSPSYFNTCFNEYYGFPPGEVKHRKEVKKHDNLFFNKSIIAFGSAMLLIVFILISIWLFTDLNLQLTSTNKDLPAETIVIAVMPFDNLSNDPNQEYFVEAITENIRGKLSSLSNLIVISKSSTRYNKSRNMSPQQIGKELDTDYLLEGSVFKVDNQILVTASLIECRSGVSMWSVPYKKEFSDIFNLQNEIALKITRELQINLTKKEHLTLQEIKEINPDVYDDFLKVSFVNDEFEDKNDSSYNKRAIGLLAQIIEREPIFAEAYVQLAWSLWRSQWYDMQFYESIGTDSILKLIDKAITLDPNYPRSYQFLAGFYFWENDLENRQKYLEKVIDLDPNNYSAMHGLIYTLFDQREYERAIKYFFRSLRIQPIKMHSDQADLGGMGFLSLYFGVICQPDKSELVLRKMIEMDSIGVGEQTEAFKRLSNLCRSQDKYEEAIHWAKANYHFKPTDLFTTAHLGRAYCWNGEYEKAIHYFELSISKENLKPYDDTTMALPNKAYAYQQLCKNDEADQILRSLINSNKKRRNEKWSWKISSMAEEHALIGNKKKALELLDSLYSMSFFTSHFILTNELLYKLKDEKEFQELVKKIKGEKEKICEIAKRPEYQREVRRLMKRLDLDP